MTDVTADKGIVLILGARSDIGRALAHEYARAGHPIYLAAREAQRLRGDTADLRIRYGVEASAYEFDVLAFASHATFAKSLPQLPEIVVCVVGLMTDQQTAEKDFDAAKAMMLTNYVGPASILGEFANAMEERGSGAIMGISSIAGERGRASNYIYGSAKAGLTAFLSGLNCRTRDKGIAIKNIKLGFVATKMTENLDVPKILTSDPDAIASKIVKAARFPSGEIYSPYYWRIISLFIRLIPQSVFARLRI